MNNFLFKIQYYISFGKCYANFNTDVTNIQKGLREGLLTS